MYSFVCFSQGVLPPRIRPMTLLNSEEKKLIKEKKKEYKYVDLYKFENFGEEIKYILFTINIDKVKNVNDVFYEIYDADLSLIESFSTRIDRNFYRENIFLDKNNIVFYYTDYTGKLKFKYIDLKKNIFSEYDGTYKINEKFDVHSIEKVNDFLYLTCRYKNLPKGAIITKFAPFLLVIDTNSDFSNIYNVSAKGDNGLTAKITNIQYLENGNLLLFVISIWSLKKYAMDIYELDKIGDEVNSVLITDNPEERILNISASKLNEKDYAISGTYSDGYIGSPEGVFFGKTSIDNVEFLKFHRFDYLENFYSFLKEKKQERVEKKIEKAKALGKTKKVVPYYGNAGNAKEIKDGYVIVIEFYRRWNTADGNGTYSYGVENVDYNFAGNIYSHAAIIKFNSTGEIMWNYTYGINPIENSFGEKQFTKVNYYDDIETIELNFPDGDKTKTLFFSLDGELIEE